MISICIPSYNYAHYLPKAIDSILSQDYTDFELIIIDDGSTDKSPEIIKEYAQKDARIKALLYKKNRGLFAIINESIKIAKGRYIHHLSADDYRMPTFLSECIKPLLAHPDVPLCFSDFGSTEDGIKVGSHALLPQIKEVRFFTAQEITKTIREHSMMIPGHTTIIKRDALLQYPFDPLLGPRSDWFLIHAIAFGHGCLYIPKTLAIFRIHPNSYSAQENLKKRSMLAVYKHVLYLIQKKESPLVRRHFTQSCLLAPFFKEYLIEIGLCFRYLSFWPPIIRKYLFHKCKRAKDIVECKEL